jgi:hypothetical protein
MPEFIMPPLSKMKRRHVYPAVGKCIYCGRKRDEVALTVEHIIAESLGGTLELPDASCTDCQKFTSAFEGQNAGRLFRPIRRQFKFPSKSRGRKDREKRENETFVVLIDGKKRNIPAKDYPGLLLSFVFPYPTALMGIAPTFESFSGGVSLGTLPEFGERLNALRAKYGNAVSFPTFGNAEDVGRLLAKTAHAYAAAELGPDGFKPYLLGIIRGHDSMLLRHLVGSDVVTLSVGDDLHEIELLPSGALGSDNLAVVRIRLFANYPGMATHYVVVGERIRGE